MIREDIATVCLPLSKGRHFILEYPWDITPYEFDCLKANVMMQVSLLAFGYPKPEVLAMFAALADYPTKVFQKPLQSADYYIEGWSNGTSA